MLEYWVSKAEKVVLLGQERFAWGSLRWGKRQRILGLQPRVRRRRTLLQPLSGQYSSMNPSCQYSIIPIFWLGWRWR